MLGDKEKVARSRQEARQRRPEGRRLENFLAEAKLLLLKLPLLFREFLVNL
jgi:hypothetical protein